jgi:hypothetical protein
VCLLQLMSQLMRPMQGVLGPCVGQQLSLLLGQVVQQSRSSANALLMQWHAVVYALILCCLHPDALTLTLVLWVGLGI